MENAYAGKNRRWRLWANPKLQGPLLVRIAVYWIVFEGIHVGTTALLIFLSGGESIGVGSVVPPLILSAFVLPFALYDMVRFSNKFAGPAMRLERTVKSLEEGAEFREVKVRRGDFFGALIGSLNRLLTEDRSSRDPDKEKLACPSATYSATQTLTESQHV